jgi:hypothetical protein
MGLVTAAQPIITCVEVCGWYCQTKYVIPTKHLALEPLHIIDIVWTYLSLWPECQVGAHTADSLEGVAAWVLGGSVHHGVQQAHPGEGAHRRHCSPAEKFIMPMNVVGTV